MSGKTTGNYRVLIVDDDFRVGALHAEMVNALPGFQALEPVQDPRVVPKVVAAQKPDLVLLDLYLPHVSGLELLPALGVDAIMISAATEPENISQAISRGALSFIIKPFGAKTLSSKLKGWARYRRQLEGAGQLDQQGIDRLYKTLQGVDDAAAPSTAISRVRWRPRDGGRSRSSVHRARCRSRRTPRPGPLPRSSIRCSMRPPPDRPSGRPRPARRGRRHDHRRAEG